MEPENLGEEIIDNSESPNDSVPAKNQSNPGFKRSLPRWKGKDRYNNAFGGYAGGYKPDFMNAPRPPPFYSPRSGPPMMPWGRGYGPMGPPGYPLPPGPPLLQGPPEPLVPRFFMEDRALKYLMRCGLAKHDLHNLPREVLMLMEPQHCGICDFSFDAFSLSRIHYMSKNHQRNIQKWLSQQEVGKRGHSREMPLKSRDLYCELCDVQITSKVHAESHYEGKQHRAVVMGRKKPKNPILLQKGKEGRVKQLIRREKKFLGNLFEEKKSTMLPKTEPKASTGELYCDICKTTMTCTDQMTMHLNGKRHLSKEKNHILKMMKVDATDETAVDESAEYEGEDDEDKGEEKDEEKDEDKDEMKEQEEADEDADEDKTGDPQIDEWANGSGENWENY